MTDPSTTTLVRDFASGRREAFRALYARVAPKLFVWCALRIPPPLQVRIDPEDLMQEIWLRSVRAMPRFDRSVAAFRAWLFGIAAKTLAETLRHLNVRRRERAPGALDFDGLPAEVTSVLGEVARREQTTKLIAACRELPDEERSLLIYRGIEELSHAEVARLIGVTPEAAEMRWRRLAGRLRSAWSAAGLDEA